MMGNDRGLGSYVVPPMITRPDRAARTEPYRPVPPTSSSVQVTVTNSAAISGSVPCVRCGHGGLEFVHRGAAGRGGGIPSHSPAPGGEMAQPDGERTGGQ